MALFGKEHQREALEKDPSHNMHGCKRKARGLHSAKEVTIRFADPGVSVT